MQILLAPLRGLTDSPFRLAFQETFSGLDASYAPFIVVARHKEKKRKEVLLKIKNNKEIAPVIPQFLGNNGEYLGTFAAEAKKLGYLEVNWNLGCPHPVVAKRGKGSGLMESPKKVRAILDEFFAFDVPELSVKIRLGWDDPEAWKKIFQVFKDFPIQKIIVHPRLGIEQYEGKASLDAFEEMQQHFDSPLIYNGDIYTLEDYEKLIQRFPALKAVMLGRGLLQNPALAEAIKGQKAEKSLKRNFQLLKKAGEQYILSMQNEGNALMHCKELWGHLRKSFPVPDASDRKKILKSKTIDEFLNRIERLTEL